MKSILDPTFKYTPSAATDLRETFKRVRRRQQREQEQAKVNADEAAKKVKPMVRAK